MQSLGRARSCTGWHIGAVARWDASVDRALATGLRTARDAGRAGPMADYMQGIAPFLGVASPDRKRVVAAVLREHPAPSPGALDALVERLYARPEREFHYAAIDVLGRHWRVLPEADLEPMASWVVTNVPWWDTVDLAGTVLVTPMVVAHPVLVDDMWAWLRSGDRWLMRAAIQHQRGRKRSTDVARLVAMCDEACVALAAEPEFFVAKAVGWALRDLAWIDARACERFLREHPGLPGVARREAERGLAAAREPGARRPGLA